MGITSHIPQNCHKSSRQTHLEVTIENYSKLKGSNRNRSHTTITTMGCGPSRQRHYGGGYGYGSRPMRPVVVGGGGGYCPPPRRPMGRPMMGGGMMGRGPRIGGGGFGRRRRC